MDATWSHPARFQNRTLIEALRQTEQDSNRKRKGTIVRASSYARIVAMIGCIGILALLAPGVVVGLVLHSWAWGIGISAVLLGIVGAVIVYRRQHRLTPEKWAAQLEKHLLGTEGPYDWKEATTRPFADPKLESLRTRIAQEYKALDTAEKKEAFRKIVESLKRDKIP